MHKAEREDQTTGYAPAAPVSEPASKNFATVRYSIASTSCRMHGIVFLLFIIQ